MGSGMTTIGDLYLDLRSIFRSQEISSPDFAARQLLCRRLGMNQTEFLARQSHYISEATSKDAWDMARRHIGGEPLAYIMGQWDFYGLTLEITRDVLIPRSDTEVLAEQAIIALNRAVSVNPERRVRALDLCCGSGCVGLAIALNVPESDVTLADNEPKALALSERNALLLQAEVRFMNADALSAPLPALGRFDVIACNPPYISDAEMDTLNPSVRLYEPEAALRGGADGLTYYRAIAELWHDALIPGGTLLFEVGFSQSRAVAELLCFSGYIHVETVRDLHGVERVVIGHKNP